MLALTRTCSSTGTKQTTLRRRLGSCATRLSSSRHWPCRSTATAKETPTGLRLVLRCRRAAAKEASSTSLLLLLGLGLLLLVRRHRRIAEEATAPAGLRRILRSRPTTTEKTPGRRRILRARGIATAREQSATSWLRDASVASAEEARPGVLT